jgi:hypothetical protein
MSRLEEGLVCERFALNDEGLIDDDVEYCESVYFYVGLGCKAPKLKAISHLWFFR